MLIRSGSVEADVRIAAVMSLPRVSFTDNFFCLTTDLAPHGIAPSKVTGAFWGDCLARGIEPALETSDVILAIDGDTVWTPKSIEALLVLLMHSGYDAIAPLQCKRESGAVMFALPGVDPSDTNSVDSEWFKKPVRPVRTAHFGLTLIRTEALKRTPKPWFKARYDENGNKTLDEDLHFWNVFADAGNKLGMATAVSVGHCELMVTWPSMSAPGGFVQQHTTTFWNGGRKAPEDAWGAIA